ncbi:MAG: tetratricopeptide repeat protein [Planctomycetota bacterium]|jgi:tetratricopeptide (TPR) repeat protein
MKKLIILSVVILSVVNAAGFSKENSAENEKLYEEVVDLLKKANEAGGFGKEKARPFFAKAIVRMETLVREKGLYNSKLYYNLGNSYLSVGNVGKAILNYRRSYRINPNDENLMQNLQYARTLCKDRIEIKTEKKIMKIFLFWYYDFSTYLRTILFAVFFLLFWCSLVVRRFNKKYLPGAVLLITAVFWASLLSSLLVEEYGRENTQYGVIVAEEIIARKGDGENYEPSFKEPVHAGTEFKVIEERAGWILIQLSDNRECWVPVMAVEII